MNEKILIIEDEVNLVELLKVNFEANFFDVVCSFNGADGLSKSVTENPDLILLDVRLPIIDGREVCRQIKNNLTTMNIPVIILTAATQKSDYINSQKVGCDLYLAKPFDPIELVETVKKILKTRGINKCI